MNHDHPSTLKHYLNDVIALERDIANATRKQIEDERVSDFTNLVPLLTQMVDGSEERIEIMRSISEEEGGKVGAAVKEATTAVTGVLAGIYGKIREHKVSKMVRDDIIALQITMTSYGMLRTLALAIGHNKVAEVALSGLRSAPPLMICLTDLLPEVVAAELSESGPISNPAAAQVVCADMREAWRQT